MVAALLHDSGKSFYPLRIWERVIIVVGKALNPSMIRHFGQDSGKENCKKASWQRPFVIARHHPAWGAELVAKTGASSLVVALIKNHHKRAIREVLSEEEELLKKLQIADRNN